jgi:hypothetical protein
VTQLISDDVFVEQSAGEKIVEQLTNIIIFG